MLGVAVATEVVPLSLSETVRQADAIVLGTATGKKAHWGDASRRWMATDYTFKVEEVLYAGPNGEGFGKTVVLTFWGGTLDGETQTLSDMRLPIVGERLVVMLRPDWREGGFTPVVGFNQGLFLVASEVPGRPALVRSDTGQALAQTAQGQVVRLRDNAKKEAKASEVDLPAFTQWLRANVQAIKSTPSEVRPAADAADPRVIKPFSKKPEPVSPRTDATFRDPAAAQAPQAGADAAKLPAAPVPSAPTTTGSGQADPMPQKFLTSHPAHPPIVVNQFPDSFAPWSPEDQYQMSKWNYYASDVFRIYTTPTGTYGWGNGCFDLAGWPSSTDLQSQYGSTWETLGAGAIGVTFLRYDGGGWIIEADIALNPSVSFTLDDEWVYDGSPAQGFRRVMHHELGHMLRLEHQSNFLSVMNYLPSPFRAFSMPYMDDAAGIRFQYSANAVRVPDLGIYLYYSSGFQNVADATLPSSVASGGTLTVNNYHVENVGTTTITTPTVEWYLTPTRNYSSAYYHIGDSTYPSLAPLTFFTPSSVERSFRIPAGVPDGDYYLAAFIRDDGGAGQSSFPFNNNLAFSRQPIAVTSAAPTPTAANDDFANRISVSGSSGTTSGSNVGATKEAGEPNHFSVGGKSVWWQWTAPASGTAIINTDSSDFDTLLAVYTGAAVNSLTQIGSNDDVGGGIQSEVIFAVSAGTSYEIAVDGYSGASGSIQLNWSLVVGTPDNDNFVNRISVSGSSSGTTSGSNVGATKETGEPNHFSVGGKSVWWQWTSPASGTATINTDTSNFDTLLAVYTGTAVNSLTLIASDDDSGIERQSQVMFSAIAGTSYEIAVDGYSGAAGSIQLNWSVGTPDIRIEPLELSFSAAANPPPLPIGPALPVSPSLRGMTASPHNFREVQPDGTPIELNIRGGVEFHWLEDSEGYTVVQEGRKFVYAQLDKAGRLAPTALQVGQKDPSTAGLRPRTLPRSEVRQQMWAERLAAAPVPTPPTAVPPVGTVKNVVILMRFANHTGRTLPSNPDFNIIFNAPGGNPILAPTGSVRDLYSENSYGTLVLDSTVYGWVTLPQTEQYYANGNSGRDPTIHQAIISALNLVDPLINFSQFDTGGDGFVDSIAFVHSGYGAEWGGTDADGVYYTSRIWSHRWQIPTWTSAEGVSVRDYHVNPGLWSTSGSAPGRIGVICHETGHFFGLPDLYDTDGGGQGIGSYCIMANSWGFTGTQLNPPHFSAWSKTFLGWMTPTLLNAPGNYSLLRAETSPTAFKISTGYPSGEYLLVENRQPFGFESTMPQGGLVIWHIDENKSENTDEGYPGQAGWPGNNQHYKVALLQADGLFNLEHGNNRGDGGDVYHGAGVSEISHSTLPNTDAYQNGTFLNTGNRIFAISGAGSTMTFSFSNDGGTSKGFLIFNDGTANLAVTAMTPDASAPWVSWTPPTPFNVPAGESRAVNVSVDFSQAPGGQSSVRLLVNSNDSDESPFPGGVNILVNKPDTMVPTLVISSPINGQTFTSSPITVSGTASDSGRGDSGIISVTVNATRASSDTASGSDTASWFSSVSLSSGANTLTVVATDSANNPVTSSIIVTYNPPLITPVTLHYQGRAAVDGIPFTGAGQFKFALVNADGSQTYWRSAVDTTPADGEPDTAISIAVSNGLYSLLLDDTAQMPAPDPTMLAHPDVRLRVWFNDGTHGFQLLSPDRPLGSLGRMGQVPFLLNYQSRIAVGGISFTGAGQFKFALVNSDGSQTYWRSAVDTTPTDGEPDTAVSATGNNGLYSLQLGDTTQMLALDPTMLDHPDVWLRVWFNDASNGFKMLSPDRRLGNIGLLGQVPFLLRACPKRLTPL